MFIHTSLCSGTFLPASEDPHSLRTVHVPRSVFTEDPDSSVLFNKQMLTCSGDIWMGIKMIYFYFHFANLLDPARCVILYLFKMRKWAGVPPVPKAKQIIEKTWDLWRLNFDAENPQKSSVSQCEQYHREADTFTRPVIGFTSWRNVIPKCSLCTWSLLFHCGVWRMRKKQVQMPH